MGNCMDNFQATNDQIKFKPYLIVTKNPCLMFTLKTDEDPFYELKNGLSQQLNPFVNIEETVNDLEPLTQISEIRVIRYQYVFELVIGICRYKY